MKYREIKLGEKIPNGTKVLCNKKWVYYYDKRNPFNENDVHINYVIDKPFPRKPLGTKEVAKTSTNSSYTAALREKCRKYFPDSSDKQVSNFIKSVQRLNASKAKHCA